VIKSSCFLLDRISQFSQAPIFFVLDGCSFSFQKLSELFHLLEFEASGEVVNPFETEFRRDERILRFLTTHMDKYHVTYAESRRNKAQDKK